MDIGTILANNPIIPQPVLLLELLILEIHYSVAQGIELSQSEYEGKFSEHASVVRKAFSIAVTPDGGCQHRSDANTQFNGLVTEAREPLSLQPAIRSTSCRYRDRKVHARGGMGEVFIASDSMIGRRVALKRLSLNSTQARQRFQKESLITGQLEHPGVVPLYDIGTDADGVPYYVMKFVEGTTLRDAIKSLHRLNNEMERHLQLVKLLQVFVSLCQTIAFAHSRGVIHRDIKPDNVLLGEFGEALIVDWGVATTRTAGTEGQAAASVPSQYTGLRGIDETVEEFAIVGSPPYMSPEAASGIIERVDELSDIYLLGATLYEILVGRAPRQGGSHSELLELARQMDPPPARAINGQIPRALNAICKKAMARQPANRYQAASELGNDVQRYLANEPVSAYRESLVERSRRWMARHRRYMVIVVVLCLALYSFREAWIQTRIGMKLKQQAVEREQIDDFRHMVDEVTFYAASSDTLTDTLPLYDQETAFLAAQRALAIAEVWGRNLQYLQNDSERDSVATELYDLLVMVNHLRLRRSVYPQDFSIIRDQLTWASQLHSISSALVELGRKFEDVSGTHLGWTLLDQPTETPVDHFLRGISLHQTALLSRRDPTLQPAWDPSMTSSKGVQGKVKLGIEEALDAFNNVIERSPQHYWAHFQRAQCLMNLGKFAEAIEALNTCIAMRDHKPWAYSARGQLYALQGDFKTALRDIEYAMELDEGNGLIRLHRGTIYRMMGPARFDDAEDDFRSLLVAPSDLIAEAAYARSQLNFLRGRKAQAIEDLDLALQRSPEFAPARQLRASLHLMFGDFDAGLADLSKTSSHLANRGALDVKGEDVLRQAVFLRDLALRVPSRRRMLVEKALEKMELVADIHKTSQFFSEQAFVLRIGGNGAESLDALKRAIELFPDEIELYRQRGWLFAEILNDPQAACSDFEKVLQKDCDDPDANAGAGYAAALMGKPELARRFAAHALLNGSEDHLVLFHVACIFARQDSESQGRDAMFACTLLRRSFELWKRGGRMGLNLPEVIASDSALATIRNTPEIQVLVSSEQIEP